MIVERRPSDERGFTLVELIIYSGLLLVVLTIVGSLLINAVRGQELVTTSSQATETGQLIARSVKQGVANASDMQTTLLTGGDEILIAHTRSTGALNSWYCQAWYFDAAGTGTLYMKRTPTMATILPNAPGPGWTLLAEGVSVRGTRIFNPSGLAISLTLTVDAGDRPPVLISTTTRQRVPRSESTACF